MKTIDEGVDEGFGKNVDDASMTKAMDTLEGRIDDALDDVEALRSIFEPMHRVELDGALTVVETLGESRPVGRALAAVGEAFGRCGDALKKHGLLTRAARMLEEDDECLAPTLVSLGSASYQLGRYASQNALLERALPLMERNACDPLAIAAVAADLARGQGYVGDFATQRQLLATKVLAILEDAHGKTHVKVADALLLLAEAHDSLKDDAAAARVRQEAFAIYQRRLGAAHPTTRRCQALCQRDHPEQHRRKKDRTKARRKQPRMTRQRSERSWYITRWRLLTGF